MKIPRKIVLDTDIILDHLTHRTGPGGTSSTMREAMRKYFCYTTVFNVIELFSLCATNRQRRAVEHALGALKILGLNGKSGKELGSILDAARGARRRDIDALVAGVCQQSRLPLLTGRPAKYGKVRSLTLVTPNGRRIEKH
ncbi:MAG TPA: type II toxin-antitoxin system VapC family toxin [Bacteroidota bacterium]|nr:type II toxin-antitoxin system VapC family toxin [Bacteroidota bacterium]